MTAELYKKHRPKSLDDVVGHHTVTNMLKGMLEEEKVPHAILLSGPSGVGKTTIARILKIEINCGAADFKELNCADFRGIDMVRDIRSYMNLVPVSGDCRVWLIDEAHQMSSPAQNAFLKILEDTPQHVYFMLCTTEPEKLIKTVRNRCTNIQLKAISNKDIEALIKKVLKKEDITLESNVISKTVELSEGSARKSLVFLNQIIHLESEEEQLETLQNVSVEGQAIEIARALINPRTKWDEMAAILKSIDEDPEGIRRMILSYCNSVLLGNGKLAPRAYNIINVFRDNFYDSGKPALTACCYEIIVRQ
jgi:DNA polymerase-3 subunit gamma/tau